MISGGRKKNYINVSKYYKVGTLGKQDKTILLLLLVQTKYGNEGSDTESSSEDDEGDEVNEEFEKDFFKALSCLKKKDPRIYDKNFEFFSNQNEEENAAKVSPKKKKEQPMYLKDYERRLILEKGGQFSDEEQENPETQYVL